MNVPLHVVIVVQEVDVTVEDDVTETTWVQEGTAELTQEVAVVEWSVVWLCVGCVLLGWLG